MTFGNAGAGQFMHDVGCDETTAFAIMDRAVEAGINFFDTAHGYSEGRSERMLGALAAKERDQLFVGTKRTQEREAPY